jgi:signal transduction histidine kinase
MKIRDRLALFVTLSAAGILLVLSLVIYYAAAAQRRQAFFNELKEEIRFREQQLQKESDHYPGFDPKATEELAGVESGAKTSFIFPVKDEKAVEDSLKTYFPSDFVEELLGEGFAEFQANEQEGAGQLLQQGGERFVIIVAADDRYGKGLLNNLKKLLGAGFLLSVPLLYIFGRLSARHILKPIAGKIRKARRISASNLHLRLNVGKQNDELGQLAMTFNDMLDRLETSFEMQKNFISNASHEIRNPLTAIIGETEVCLARRRAPEEYIESLHHISREADRLEALVKSLLSLAQTGFDETQLVREETRLDEVLLEARQMVHKAYQENRIKIDFSALPENPDWITVYGNSNLLRVAFSNLMENACKFSDQQEVLVMLSASEKAIQIRIIDKGMGIPQHEIKNLFQPFYRARNARSYKGFGIGLSLTDKIIRLHKGQINILSEEGKGTTMEVCFEH